MSQSNLQAALAGWRKERKPLVQKRPAAPEPFSEESQRSFRFRTSDIDSNGFSVQQFLEQHQRYLAPVVVAAALLIVILTVFSSGGSQEDTKFNSAHAPLPAGLVSSLQLGALSPAPDFRSEATNNDTSDANNSEATEGATDKSEGADQDNASDESAGAEEGSGAAPPSAGTPDAQQSQSTSEGLGNDSEDGSADESSSEGADGPRSSDKNATLQSGGAEEANGTAEGDIGGGDGAGEGNATVEIHVPAAGPVQYWEDYEPAPVPAKELGASPPSSSAPLRGSRSAPAPAPWAETAASNGHTNEEKGKGHTESIGQQSGEAAEDEVLVPHERPPETKGKPRHSGGTSPSRPWVKPAGKGKPLARHQPNVAHTRAEAGTGTHTHRHSTVPQSNATTPHSKAVRKGHKHGKLRKHVFAPGPCAGAVRNASHCHCVPHARCERKTFCDDMYVCRCLEKYKHARFDHNWNIVECSKNG